MKNTKEYKVVTFQKNGKWFYRLTEASTWNSVVLTESQYTKCVEHGIKTF